MLAQPAREVKMLEGRVVLADDRRGHQVRRKRLPIPVRAEGARGETEFRRRAQTQSKINAVLASRRGRGRASIAAADQS